MGVIGRLSCVVWTSIKTMQRRGKILIRQIALITNTLCSDICTDRYDWIVVDGLRYSLLNRRNGSVQISSASYGSVVDLQWENQSIKSMSIFQCRRNFPDVSVAGVLCFVCRIRRHRILLRICILESRYTTDRLWTCLQFVMHKMQLNHIHPKSKWHG